MRNRERWLALVLALLLTLPVTAGAGTAEPEWKRIDVTADAEAAYLLQDNELWRLNGAYEPEERLCAYEVDVRNLFARDEGMYVAYRDGGAIHFARQADSGELDELFAVEGEVDVYDFAVVGDTLAVLWQMGDHDAYLPEGVRRFSAYSMMGEERDFDVEFAAAIAPCEGGRLLLAYGEEEFWEVFAIDPASGERQQIPTQESGTIMAIAGTPEELYLLNDTGMGRLSEDGGLDVLQMVDCSDTPGMVRVGDDVVGFAMDRLEGDPILFTYDCSEVVEKRTLTVWLRGDVGLMDNRMNRAIRKLQSDEPGARVEFVSETLDTFMDSEERMKAILMAGGDGADLVLVTSGGDEDLINSGAFLDLNESPELRQALEPLEYLLSLVTNDKGELYGVPAIALIDKIYEFQQLKSMEPADFDIGNCTWMELLEAAMQFGGRSGVAFFMDLDTDSPTWLRQYIAAEGDELSFDTPLFRELAEAYRTALNAGKIQSSFGSNWENALYMLDSRDSDSLYGDILLPPPALEADRPARLAQMDALAVNARGNHLELALQLLLNYLDPEVVYADGGYDHLRLDEAEYVDMAQFSERERALILENQAAYAQALPCRETYGFLVACQNWMPQYYAGEITLDELVSNLQREWDMRRLG